MRTNLIMHFHCSECGSRLNIKYEKEQTVKNKAVGCSEEIPREPTGANCRYVPAIQIEPCKKCIEKYTTPARKLSEALKSFEYLNGVDE